MSPHSSPVHITRDWQQNFGLVPDQISGWELGPERRKPSPYALQTMMQTCDLGPSQLVMIDD